MSAADIGMEAWSADRLAATIDHTLLKAEATPVDIGRLCEEAIKHRFFAVCIHPVYVTDAVRILGSSPVRVCTVTGFPLGANRTEIKVEEARRAAGKALCKVILETCLLTPAERETACRLCVEAGADFVKTSTGLNSGGATIEDVRLMSRCVSAHGLGVKAAGGIRTLASAIAMLNAGATRIGSSNSVAILRETVAALERDSDE